MLFRRLLWWVALIAALVVLCVAWWLSRAEFAQMKAYIDGHSPDGEVESYDLAFHQRMSANMARVAWMSGGLILLLFAARRWFFRVREAGAGAFERLVADTRHAWHKLKKRTTTDHKRFVLFLIVVGAILRISQLPQDVVYDEAFTYTNYVTQPFHFIFSNYTYPNNHILHSALVKIATAIFGPGRWALRLPALLAGILVMPLFYVFVRAMFNRYIAVITLAFVASSGALIEYSALARGYSLTWFFMVCALIAGRHFVKRDNLASALLVAFFNAMAMWTVTSALYASMMVYIWLLLYLIGSYQTTLRRRLLKLVASFAVFLGLTLILYTPVIIVHNLDQLLHHPTMGENTWESFTRTHQDKAFELWFYINDTAAPWLSILGFAGVFYAAYISVRYRILLVAMILGSVPLVMLQSMIGPPRIWLYILFILHLSSGIALFYFFKMLQATVFPSLSKKMRTAGASVLVLAGFGWLGVKGIQNRVERQGDSRLAVELLHGIIKPGDRVLSKFPWEAAFEYYLMVDGQSRDLVHKGPAPGGATYVLVSPAHEQTLGGVLLGNGLNPADSVKFEKMKDWRLLEIFAPR